MKMWKKLAACVMAAAMALTLLTACGGGGGSTGGGSGSNSVVRDKTKEDQAISWVQEYAANNGVTMEKSDAVSNAASAGLADMVRGLDIQRDAAEAILMYAISCWISTRTSCKVLYTEKRAFQVYWNTLVHRSHCFVGIKIILFKTKCKRKLYIFLIFTLLTKIIKF